MGIAAEITHQSTDWITMIFMAVLVLLVVLNLFFNQRLTETFVAFFDKKVVYVSFNKEKQLLVNWFQILFFVLQALVLSLFFLLVSTFFVADDSIFELELYVIILGTVVAYFLIRFLTSLFLSFILDLQSPFRKIFFEKTTYLNNMILWMLPFIFFAIYSSQFQSMLIVVTMVIFVSLLAFRYALLLRNNKKLLFNDLFYFILYLCALEIAPIVIVVKFTT